MPESEITEDVIQHIRNMLYDAYRKGKQDRRPRVTQKQAEKTLMPLLYLVEPLLKRAINDTKENKETLEKILLSKV